MTTWFTSDLHFHHKNIVEFTDRKEVITQDRHDEWLIELWNSRVKKGDTIYHLGDFSFSHKIDEIKAVLYRLAGQKFFIKGNHDDDKTMRKLAEEGFIHWYGTERNIKIGGVKTILYHFPIACWDRQVHGSYHLHGHTHGNYYIEHGKILDVGIDNHFRNHGFHDLYSEDAIIRNMALRETHAPDNRKTRSYK